MRSLSTVSLAALVSLACASCGNSAKPSADAPSSLGTPQGSSPNPSDAAPSAEPSAAGSGTASAQASAAPTADPAASASPEPEVADNKVAPTEGAELQARARGLFDAVVKDEPERADAFWFPKAPFIPLKDVKEPGKYWEQLHRTYVNDVHALHKKRKSWDGAEFVSFEGWSRTKWVPPGDEANKIGYHRAFHGKLRYKVGGEESVIDVHTIITWQGKWYVTHLRKFKK